MHSTSALGVGFRCVAVLPSFGYYILYLKFLVNLLFHILFFIIISTNGRKNLICASPVHLSPAFHKGVAFTAGSLAVL
jgi:hypothetical protein